MYLVLHRNYSCPNCSFDVKRDLCELEICVCTYKSDEFSYYVLNILPVQKIVITRWLEISKALFIEDKIVFYISCESR